MSLFTIVLLIVLGVLGLVIFVGTRTPRLMTKGFGMGVAAVPELTNLCAFITKVQGTKFNGRGMDLLKAVLTLQILYIHDSVGLIAAIGIGDYNAVLGVLQRVAFEDEFLWTNYVNKLTAQIRLTIPETGAEQEEIDRLVELFRESAQVVMPLRNKLASEFQKAGITWKSVK